MGVMRITGLGHASVLIDTAHGSILTTDSPVLRSLRAWTEAAGSR